MCEPLAELESCIATSTGSTAPLNTIRSHPYNHGRPPNLIQSNSGCDSLSDARPSSSHHGRSRSEAAFNAARLREQQAFSNSLQALLSSNDPSFVAPPSAFPETSFSSTQTPSNTASSNVNPPCPHETMPPLHLYPATADPPLSLILPFTPAPSDTLQRPTSSSHTFQADYQGLASMFPSDFGLNSGHVWPPTLNVANWSPDDENSSLPSGAAWDWLDPSSSSPLIPTSNAPTSRADHHIFTTDLHSLNPEPSLNYIARPCSISATLADIAQGLPHDLNRVVDLPRELKQHLLRLFFQRSRQFLLVVHVQRFLE